MSSPVPRSYADAGRCGFALGLVLLASFVLAGRGLGASGAFAVAAGETLTTLGVRVTDPALLDRIPVGLSLLNDWIVLEIAGVMIGGALSAWLARRMRFVHTSKRNDTGLPLTRERRESVRNDAGLPLSRERRESNSDDTGLPLSRERRESVRNDAGLPLSWERREGPAVVPDKRAKASADPGPSVVPSSIGKALAGGALMGLGARLAYGCTSGLALSGGALMATGAWVFIPIAFGTAMAVTLLPARRLEDA